MGLSSVLPFLAALKKQTPDMSTFQQGADAPAALGNAPDPLQQSLQAAQPLASAAQGDSSQMPPAPPSPIAQQPVSQLPDVGTGEPQAAPEDKGNALRQPYESKGHALLRILQSGLVGGLSGLSQNAATYAATGRNAGFGGGVGAGFTQALPMQAAFQQLGLQKAGLENQQLIQMLPFLRAQNIAGLQKTSAEAQKFSAEAGKAQAETGAIPAETALKNAQAFAANYKEQNGILYNLQTGKPLTPDASGMVETPADIAGAMGVKPGTKLPAKQITDARNAYYGHLNGSDPSIIAQIGPPPVNDRNALVQWGKQAEAIKTREASAPRINMMLARPLPVAADPNNPGAITYMPAGQAMSTGAAAPSSAATTEAKSEARSEVPTKIGDQRVAFNTMIQHAQLLRQAAAALNNGDVQALNGLKNSFKNQFGYSGPITAEAIADAYKGEVSNVINKGHITDAGNEKVAHTLDPTHQNYQTVDSVLGAYQGLAQSKLNMLNQQANIAKGQASPQAQNQVGPPVGASHAVVINGKIVGYTSDGKTMTPAP